MIRQTWPLERPGSGAAETCLVEFVFEGRKCRLHVPVPNLSAWKLKILVFKAFTDISEPFFVLPTEVAGVCFEMIEVIALLLCFRQSRICFIQPKSSPDICAQY